MLETERPGSTNRRKCESLERPMPDVDEMIRVAAKAQANAHAPYSGFRVGACVRSRAGRLFGGCNVENASYPEGHCAETGAIAAMVAAGDKEIVAVVVLGPDDSLCTPCGGCRQRLAEFAGPATPVHIAGPEGLRQTFTLEALLPATFAFHGGAR